MKEYYSGFVEGFSPESLDNNPLQIKVFGCLRQIIPDEIYKLDEVDYNLVDDYSQLVVHSDGYSIDIEDIGVYEAIDLGVIGFSKELDINGKFILSNTKDSDSYETIHLYYLVGRLN